MQEWPLLDSPYRLTALTIAGILLAGIGFIGASVHAVYTSLPLLWLCFLCVVVGLIVSFWLPVRLRDAVQNETWSDATLAPFRKITGSVLWKIATAVLLVAMFAALRQDRHHRTWFWPVFIALQVQTQLGTAFLRPRRPNGPSTRLDWSTISPLRSEHWGER